VKRSIQDKRKQKQKQAKEEVRRRIHDEQRKVIEGRIKGHYGSRVPSKGSCLSSKAAMLASTD
jgi:hypothetical protein